MFKSIRRNSKQLLESRRKSVPAIVTETNPPTITPRPRKLTFFDLPAEIRNVIYEHIAEETRILVPLPQSGKKPTKLPPPTPSLLLVSKQIRPEYLPLLLECASITFQVKDFDFRNLMRITSSLYSTELKALRHNSQLRIRLHLDKMRPDSLQALRRWLVNRSEHLDRLNFHYAITWPRHTQIIPTSTQVHKVNIYMQRRAVLSQNLEAMSHLHHNVEEALQFELQPLVRVLEDEQMLIGQDPALPWSDNSALMMFGVPIRAVRS
jgi:hypothetical protein